MTVGDGITHVEMEKKSRPSQTKKSRVNFQENTVERNFITPGRAISEFLLKPSQLEGLQKNYRRSPYETELSILVYNRRDVERRAVQIWGSPENLEDQQRKREIDKKIFDQYIYESKRSLREARRSAEQNRLETRGKRKREAIIIGLAITIDFLNFCFKLAAWIVTNSDSMLAEAIHSAADTFNESILVIGICQAQQEASPRHPYGYHNMMYVVSLISGVGIFCLGASVSVFKGISTLTHMQDDIVFDDIYWAFSVLGFGFLTESVTLGSAIFASCKGSRKLKMNYCAYVFLGNEPGINVVLMEDTAAVLGTITAASTLFFSWQSQSRFPDALGSILIGCLLACVALFLIITNATALVGRSIPKEKLEHINKRIESDVMIRAIYDVKGIDIGNNLVRYKAEIDFDGTELTRLYLDRLNLTDMLNEVKQIKTIDDLETFMVTHGENIVDLMGGEIDRIELKVRNEFPEVRHMDLEIL